jgi:excisionase family DNA binding protein
LPGRWSRLGYAAEKISIGETGRFPLSGLAFVWLGLTICKNEAILMAEVVTMDLSTQNVPRKTPFDDWLTTNQVAESTGRSRAAVSNAIIDATLPATRVGGRFFIHRAAMESWAAARRVSRKPMSVPETDARIAQLDPAGRLSPREKQTLIFLLDGLTRREIAKRFGICVSTGDVFRKGICAKLALTGATPLKTLVEQYRGTPAGGAR